MKELKFRVWDIERECYLNETELAGITPDGKYIWYIEEEEISRLEIDENYVVEYDTGLKDKNGKDIYEGDILGDMWRDGYIAWCDKCKQLQYHILTDECMACLGDVQWYELVNDNGKLEVVGNVHENPDLLEDK